MIRKTIILAFFAVVLAGINSLNAQTPGTQNTGNTTPDSVRTEAERQRRKIEGPPSPDRNLKVVPRNGRKKDPETDEPPLSKEELEAIRNEATEEYQKFAVGEEYGKTYKAFLDLEETGIERLFEDKGCGKGKVTTLAEIERCADVPQGRNGGSWVTFRCRSRTVNVRDFRPWMEADCRTKFLRDLTFRNGMFVAGNDGVIQGIIVDIGDVDLEGVKKSHKAVEFLFDYDPKQTFETIAKQKEVLAKGINTKGFFFSDRVPVKLNSTYVLRSVLYRYQEAGAPNPPYGADVRMVFKVVGIEPDGSVVIVWKEMDRQHPRRQIEQE
jgi:hypothetical protein